MARRNFFVSLTTTAAIAALLAIPGFASANTYWHPTNNEIGAKAYPEHFQSTKTREQVRAEAEQAVREGGDARFVGSNYPAPVKNMGPGKTRQQVLDELMNETPAEREARRLEMAS